MGEESFFVQKAKQDFRTVIIQLSETHWRDTLYRALDPPFVKLTSDATYGGQSSMDNLLDLVENELTAKSAVIEPYISTDWNSEYGDIYCRAFADVPMYAQRIHFFKERIEYEDLYDIRPELRMSR